MIQAARISHDVESLAAFTQGRPGVTRLSYTAQQRQAQQYLTDAMRAAGLEVSLHPSGNLIGRFAGQNAALPPVVTGSHYDTVRSGGAYDGVAGVVTALEAFRDMKESGYAPVRDILFVAFVEEEGTRFNAPTLGSKLLMGELSEEELFAIEDAQGTKLVDAMREAGLDAREALAQCWKGKPLHAFVELHIEQGPVLEQAGASIGVVTGINGMISGEVTVHGQADHAGAIPMEARHDALRGAVSVIRDFYELAYEVEPGAVATVGRIAAQPGSANVIPQSAAFSVDFRYIQDDVVDAIKQKLLRRLDALQQEGLSAQYTQFLLLNAVHMNAGIQQLIERSAANRGYAHRAIASGACHDAVTFAKACPTGMIFVPSHEGRSHCPEEYTELADLSCGAQVLADVLRDLAMQAYALD